jgi:hypothetical protein
LDHRHRAPVSSCSPRGGQHEGRRWLFPYRIFKYGGSLALGSRRCQAKHVLFVNQLYNNKRVLNRNESGCEPCSTIPFESPLQVAQHRVSSKTDGKRHCAFHRDLRVGLQYTSFDGFNTKCTQSTASTPANPPTSISTIS